MGQKINPIGFRLSVNRNWTSKWYANSKHFAPTLNEDIKVRQYLKTKLAHASVGKRRFLGHIEDVGPDMRVGPQADLKPGRLQ